MPAKRIRTPTVRLLEAMSNVEVSPERGPVVVATAGKRGKTTTTTTVITVASSPLLNTQETVLESWQMEEFRSLQVEEKLDTYEVTNLTFFKENSFTRSRSDSTHHYKEKIMLFIIPTMVFIQITKFRILPLCTVY